MKMTAREYFRNNIVFNPAALLLASVLQTIASHRVAGLFAIGMALIGPVVSAWPAFSRFVEGHRIVLYCLAALAWVVGAAQFVMFLIRIAEP